MSQQNMLRPAPVVQYTRDYFVYAVNFGVIAPQTTVIGNIQIQSDSDFIWEAGTYFSVNPAASVQTSETLSIPAINIQITDTGSGRLIYNQPIPVHAIFGQGAGLPYPLIQPREFKARSSIAFTATNTEAANSYQLYLLLHGSKNFPMGR